MKFSQRLERLVDLPENPSTGKLIVVSVRRKSMYSYTRVVRGGITGTAPHTDRPCCIYL